MVDTSEQALSVPQENREKGPYDDVEIPELVPDNHPMLKQKLEQFDFSDPPEDPLKIAQILLKAVKKYNGLAISANQLGLPYRVFALRGNPILGIDNFVCFNPRVASTDGDDFPFKEGCLTYPNLYITIKRPTLVRARFQSPYGEVITKQLGGLVGRCYLHEYDHMEGIVFFDRANKHKREKAKKDWKLIQRRMK